MESVSKITVADEQFMQTHQLSMAPTFLAVSTVDETQVVAANQVIFQIVYPNYNQQVEPIDACALSELLNPKTNCCRFSR